MAEVWTGEAVFDDGEQMPVAIKRVRPELASDPFYRTMFRDEARLGMLLRHDNIVRVYDAREVEGTFILIMELVRGPSLRALMNKAFEREAPMPTEAALRLGLGLAEALRYAHGAIDDMGRSLDIVHRDVSPHNVLLGQDGSVKLMDFGLAYASANDLQRDPDEIGGKLGYLAPEILLHKQSSPRIDVFALGVTLWEALAGRRLFRGESDHDTVRRVAACYVPPIERVNPRVPRLLGRVLGAALSRDPAQRPTAEQLLEALADVARRAGVSDDNESLRRLVYLHEQILATGQRPVRVSGSISLSAAERLEHELVHLAREGSSKAVIVSRSPPPAEQSAVEIVASPEVPVAAAKGGRGPR